MCMSGIFLTSTPRVLECKWQDGKEKRNNWKIVWGKKGKTLRFKALVLAKVAAADSFASALHSMGMGPVFSCVSGFLSFSTVSTYCFFTCIYSLRLGPSFLLSSSPFLCIFLGHADLHPCPRMQLGRSRALLVPGVGCGLWTQKRRNAKWGNFRTCKSWELQKLQLNFYLAQSDHKVILNCFIKSPACGEGADAGLADTAAGLGVVFMPGGGGGGYFALSTWFGLSIRVKRLLVTCSGSGS